MAGASSAGSCIWRTRPLTGQNAAFAEQYLKDEGLNYLGGSVGGDQPRRIQFWPVSGRVRQMQLPADEAPSVERQPPVRRAPVQDDGAVEFF